MNIFVTDSDPIKAAQNLCDKHVPKMVLESCQMLCSVFEPGIAPYKRTHYNHPCSIWVRTSLENYFWLIEHAWGITEEYTKRFGKLHKCSSVLFWVTENCKKLHFPLKEQTQFVQAMPPEYKVPDDPIMGYRNYYKGAKARFAKWNKGTSAPDWWS